MIIRGYRLGPLVSKTVREIGADNVTTLAASAAYNFFFSLFPLLLFLAPLLSLAADKQRMVGLLVGQLASVVPAPQLEVMRPVLEKVVFAPHAPGLMSIGLVLAAWSGSNVFGTLMGALNTAYDVDETRPWIKQQLIRLGVFVLGCVILALSTIVFLNGGGAANWIGGLIGLGSAAMLAWKIGQPPLAFAAFVLLTFVALYFLPNVHQHWGHALIAAIVTTLLWLAATLLFRIYVNHFPPNPAYGVIGGVIVLLTWMYYTMFVVLVGGELASELHCGTGTIAPEQRSNHSTTRAQGHPQPT